MIFCRVYDFKKDTAILSLSLRLCVMYNLHELQVQTQTNDRKKLPTSLQHYSLNVFDKRREIEEETSKNISTREITFSAMLYIQYQMHNFQASILSLLSNRIATFCSFLSTGWTIFFQVVGNRGFNYNPSFVRLYPTLT